MVNTALLLVSGRPELRDRAIALLRDRHERLVLVLPPSMVAPADSNLVIVRTRTPRFSFAGGLWLALIYRRAWDRVYYLSADPSDTGYDNVLTAAVMAGKHVTMITPSCEMEKSSSGHLRALAKNALALVAATAIFLPCWMLSSLTLLATGRR